MYVCVFARFSAGQEVASSCAGHRPTPGCCSAAALGRFCFLNVFFEGSNFCFTFSSFHGINLNQQICGCFWRSRIWTDFFFLLFVCTHIHTNTRAHDALFFSHTVTVAALPYDGGGEQQQNPDDIIILHLGRPRQTKCSTEVSSFAASWRTFFFGVSNSTAGCDNGNTHTNARTHSLTRGWK